MKLYTDIVDNLDEIMDSSIEYAMNESINKILIFSKNGNSAIKLKHMLQEKSNSTSVIAVLFPANERLFERDEDGKVNEIIPNSLDKNTMSNLKSLSIQPVYGTLPLENVIVPGASNNIYSTIKQALSLFSPGLQLAVQGVLMATDQGFLKDNERVVSIVSDIAIDVNSANSRLMFHPEYGLSINHIVAQKKKQD
ncbi:hypothetical protein AZI11_08440 [Levilactobacillus brevis]|uniref:hypothetical protein n=1 Tax=Levilactobacillus brevis TaxID=1580 RepID=UPI000A20B5A2|nr:hypothetical protein [Levilactobacillus brevis]ARN92928.1 hypothetical protein AZI11_08440 [Levilactobacillus brevis]ARN95572.1 hypothetical protein AZI12_08490 [Levilactobacillus brevis]MBS0978718.1 hypothetical protein [Levilactobacillus brevis]